MIHTYFPASQSCFRFSFSLPLKLTWQGCTLPLTNHLFFGSLWDPTSPRIFSAPFAMPIIKSPDEATLLLRIEVGGFLSLVAKATQRSAALQKGYFAPSVSLIPESDKIHGYPWQERQTWRKSASLELLTPIISIWFNLIWSNLTTFIFFGSVSLPLPDVGPASPGRDPIALQEQIWPALEEVDPPSRPR